MKLLEKIARIAVGTLLGLWFLLAGAQKFLSRPAFNEMFGDFGLPLWAVPIIGVIELLGGILVLIPRTAVYGAGVIIAVMIGAAGCHLISGVGSPIGALIAIGMALFVGTMRLRVGRS